MQSHLTTFLFASALFLLPDCPEPHRSGLEKKKIEFENPIVRQLVNDRLEGNTSSPATRAHAALALANMGVEARLAVPSLLKRLQDYEEDEAVQDSCAYALGEIASALSADDEQRMAAIDALKNSLAQRINPAQEYSARIQRRTIVDALAKIGENNKSDLHVVVPILEKRMNEDVCIVVRERCAKTLGIIGGNAAIDGLVRHLEKANSEKKLQFESGCGIGVGGQRQQI